MSGGTTSRKGSAAAPHGHHPSAPPAAEPDLSPDAPEALLGSGPAAELHPTAYRLLTRVGRLNERAEILEKLRGELTRDEVSAVTQRRIIVDSFEAEAGGLAEERRSDRLEERLAEAERRIEEAQTGAAASFDETLALPRKEGT